MKIANKKRKDIICYEKLRSLLLSGELRPGTRIGEVEWSERLGGNPAALREAMTRLADQGLLKRGAKGGYFIPDYSEKETSEIDEVRTIVGVGAIKLIEKRGLSEKELKPLLDICNTMEQLLINDLGIGYREADRKFHDTLIDLSGNKRLIKTYHNVSLPVLHSTPTDPDIRRKLDIEGLKKHRDIYKYLCEGKYEKAARVLEEHIETNLPETSKKSSKKTNSRKRRAVKNKPA